MEHGMQKFYFLLLFFCFLYLLTSVDLDDALMPAQRTAKFMDEYWDSEAWILILILIFIL